jgi:acetate kinase
MKVLVLNAGSSSIKYQVIDAEREESLIRGIIDEIGSGSSGVHYVAGDKESERKERVRTHSEAIGIALKCILEAGVVEDLREIDAVGHRVVHGGERFTGTVPITDEVVKVIDDLIDLAPLHNPHNLAGILACRDKLPGVDQYAVFDTAFHSSLPKKAFLYGLPYELYNKHGIRKYGFHGISHKYVAHQAMRILKEDIKDFKIVTCHLGNGSSLSAVRYGNSIETSMGFTPLDGLMMGTRSGSFDPEIIPFLIRRKGYTIEEVEDMMNRRSGLMGISTHTSDVRNLREEELEGNETARLALEMFVYRVQKFIGSHTAAMGGVDVIVFTGGIGEKAYYLRRMICMNFDYVGLKLDMNANRNNETIISAKDSRVTAMVIPTNEELQIVREVKAVRAEKPAA